MQVRRYYLLPARFRSNNIYHHHISATLLFYHHVSKMLARYKYNLLYVKYERYRRLVDITLDYNKPGNSLDRDLITV